MKSILASLMLFGVLLGAPAETPKTRKNDPKSLAVGQQPVSTHTAFNTNKSASPSGQKEKQL